MWDTGSCLPSIWLFLHSGSWSLSLTLSWGRPPVIMSGTKPTLICPWIDRRTNLSTRETWQTPEERLPTPPAIVSNLSQNHRQIHKTCRFTTNYDKFLLLSALSPNVYLPWNDPWTLNLSLWCSRVLNVARSCGTQLVHEPVRCNELLMLIY